MRRDKAFCAQMAARHAREVRKCPKPFAERWPDDALFFVADRFRMPQAPERGCRRSAAHDAQAPELRHIQVEAAVERLEHRAEFFVEQPSHVAALGDVQ